MSGKTGIGWTDYTWNPVVGCDKVSPGCKLCYAKDIHDMRRRAFLEGKKVAPQYAHPFETIQLMPNRLDWPLSLRKPSFIFVNSVSDLFHEDVPDEFIAQVFSIMALARRHTFQVLTKRPKRMRDLLADGDFIGLVGGFMDHYSFEKTNPHNRTTYDIRATAPDVDGGEWPLSNVHIGVSAENQKYWDERGPLLLETPAAFRFVSAEPLLGSIDFGFYHANVGSAIGAVIVGGESGSAAQKPRPMHPEWAMGIRDQCRRAGVRFTMKQWGDYLTFAADSPCDYLTFAADSPCLRTDGAELFARVDGKVYRERSIQFMTESGKYEPSAAWAVRVGTKRAGRQLEGEIHDEYPWQLTQQDLGDDDDAEEDQRGTAARLSP